MLLVLWILSSPFDCRDRLGFVGVDQSKHPNMTIVDIQISSPLISARLWQEGRADERELNAVEAGTLKSLGSRLQQSEPGGGGCLITLSRPPHAVTAEAGRQPDGEGWRASAQITAITEWTSHWWEPRETKVNDFKINQILTTAHNRLWVPSSVWRPLPQNPTFTPSLFHHRSWTLLHIQSCDRD